MAMHMVVCWERFHCNARRSWHARSCSCSTGCAYGSFENFTPAQLTLMACSPRFRFISSAATRVEAARKTTQVHTYIMVDLRACDSTVKWCIQRLGQSTPSTCWVDEGAHNCKSYKCKIVNESGFVGWPVIKKKSELKGWTWRCVLVSMAEEGAAPFWNVQSEIFIILHMIPASRCVLHIIYII